MAGAPARRGRTGAGVRHRRVAIGPDRRTRSCNGRAPRPGARGRTPVRQTRSPAAARDAAEARPGRHGRESGRASAASARGRPRAATGMRPIARGPRCPAGPTRIGVDGRRGRGPGPAVWRLRLAERSAEGALLSAVSLTLILSLSLSRLFSFLLFSLFVYLSISLFSVCLSLSLSPSRASPRFACLRGLGVSIRLILSLLLSLSLFSLSLSLSLSVSLSLSLPSLPCLRGIGVDGGIDGCP